MNVCSLQIRDVLADIYKFLVKQKSLIHTVRIGRSPCSQPVHKIVKGWLESSWIITTVLDRFACGQKV